MVRWENRIEDEGQGSWRAFIWAGGASNIDRSSQEDAACQFFLPAWIVPIVELLHGLDAAKVSPYLHQSLHRLHLDVSSILGYPLQASVIGITIEEGVPVPFGEEQRILPERAPSGAVMRQSGVEGGK